MVVATVGAGRPRAVADINFDNNEKVAFIERFQSVCSTFHYHEEMALSRALGITDRAVRSWKYKEYFPRWDTAVDVLDWVDRGKPIRLVPPSQ